jgi:hypothetical protein
MMIISPTKKALWEPMKVVSNITFFGAKGRAMIIDRCPALVQGFFRPFKLRLSKAQYAHLWALVVALAINLRRANVLCLSELLPESGHRTSHGGFLGRSDWDSAALVEMTAANLLLGMKPRPGEVLHLLLDDTRMLKRGKKMGLLSKIWDHKEQKFGRGHVALAGVMDFRGVVLPWRMELWKPRKAVGKAAYVKLTDMAAAMIRDFQPPAGVKVRVLFDAFYLCPAVTQACQGRGFTWFSVASKNRTFTSGGKRRKIGRLAKGRLRHKGKAVPMDRSGKRRVSLRITACDGQLARIGPVRMVLSKRPHDRWKNLVAIVTDETGLSDWEIVCIYEKRWSIEVLFKELKEQLGLGDYQVISQEAILKHLHLVCLAHLLLTHRAMEGVGEKARTALTDVPLPTMKHRLEALRRDVKNEQIQRLFRRKPNAGVFRRLKTYLLAA